MGSSDHNSNRPPWTGRSDQRSADSTAEFYKRTDSLRRFSGPLRSLLTLTLLAWPLSAFAQAEQPPVTEVTADSYPITTSRDWEGLKRDTWYFMGAQVGSLGILSLMPEAVTNWSEEQKESFSLAKWRENMSHPHLDKDDFYLNYLLHPYWGATYYVRAGNGATKNSTLSGTPRFYRHSTRPARKPCSNNPPFRTWSSRRFSAPGWASTSWESGIG